MALATLMARIRLLGVQETQRGLAQVRQGFHDAGEAAKKMGGHATVAMRDLARGMVDVAQKATLLGGALVVGGSVAAYEVAVKMDSLTRSLASTATNADDLRQQLARLKEVAKLPGLGFEEAIQGSVKLQAAGLSASLAERSLKSFGNALALAGGGKDQLDGTITALSQIQSKGKLSAEEINQLAERVPQIRQLMQQAFGTSETDKIQKMGLTATQAIQGLVSAAERLPSASGGFQNAMENLQQGFKDAIKPLGDGIAIALDAAMPFLTRFFSFLEGRATMFGEVFVSFAKSGVIESVLTNFAAGMEKMLGGDFRTGLIGVFANVAAVVESIPAAFSTAGRIAYMIGVDVQKMVGYLMQAAPLVGELVTNTFKSAFGGGIEQGGSNQGQAEGKSGEVVRSSLLDGLLEKGAGALLTKFLSSKAGKVISNPLVKDIAGGLLGLGVAERLMGGGMDALNNKDASGKTLRDRFEALQLEGMYGLKDFQNVWAERPTMDMIGKRAEMFSKMALGSLGPLSDLPDGLNYKTGGKGGAAGASGESGADPIERLLMAIEKNTKQAADTLSLRAQTLGGGELAGLGVTPAELRAAGVSGFGPEKYEYLPRVPINQMEQLQRQIAREEYRRGSGKGRVI